MSNLSKLRSDDERYQEAGLWIERLSEGITQQEEVELSAWLDQDATNWELLQRMAQLWDKMDSLSRLSDLVPHPTTPIGAGRHRLLFRAIAAALVLGFSTLLFWYVSMDPTGVSRTAQLPAEVIYETAVGERQRFTLDDGTTLTLNTRTRINVRYTPAARLLRLEAGEVHVQVAKDPQRPLSVLVGGHVVQALGTAFNIELRPDLKIELVVTEGSVRLGPQVTSEEQSRNDVKIRLPDSAKVITAGQEVVMNQGIDQAMPISESEIQVRLSWQKGNLVFRGETLAVAVQEVERYTGVEFIFLDESLKEVRVSGFFRAGDVDGMLAVLKENFDISFQHESETRVLLYSMRTPDSQ